MAYDKKKIYKQALKAIEDYKPLGIEELVSYLPCNKDTFYRFFPLKSDEYDTIRAKIDENKVKIKASIRHKLYTLDNPTALVSLYKLLATPEERDALSSYKSDITTNGKEISQEPIVIRVVDSREQVERLQAENA